MPRWLIFVCALAVLLVAQLPLWAVVPDDDMAPSLLPGDWVLLWRRAPRDGEVVAVVDPLDSGRWTLRRVEATEGTIRYEGGILMGPQSGDVVELGREGGMVYAQEGEHLLWHLPTAVRWDMEELIIAEGTMFLSADNREGGMDSRWWGPVPLEAVQGVVLFRLGAPGHRWRGWGGKP